MTATNETIPPTAEDSHSSLAVGTTAQTDGSESHSKNSQPPATLEHRQTSSIVPSVNGGHNQPETPVDPKVAALLSMFPDFDMSLLQSVLESVAGDQDRAVDVLLGMSDPSYTSTERADVTQTELDEEIARRLMLEESEQQAAWRPRDASSNLPYQPRTGPMHPSDRQHPTEGDGMNQFQEQLGRFAETGKKTFNTFLSKVKAKIQEFDNPSGQAQLSGSPQPLPGGDSWSTPVQSQTYYDPNPPSSAHGYDMGTTVPSGQPPTTSVNHSITAAQPAASPAPEISSSPPASGTSAPGNVDPSKLGLLPKRPVALGSSAQPSRHIIDDDEVEYVENPFEESAHR